MACFIIWVQLFLRLVSQYMSANSISSVTKCCFNFWLSQVHDSLSLHSTPIYLMRSPKVYRLWRYTNISKRLYKRYKKIYLTGCTLAMNPMYCPNIMWHYVITKEKLLVWNSNKRTSFFSKFTFEYFQPNHVETCS